LFFTDPPKYAFQCSIELNHVSKFLRQTVNRIAPHQFGACDEFQVVKRTIGAVAIPEHNRVSCWDWPFVLLPNVALQ
jgi:hypothetical protein